MTLRERSHHYGYLGHEDLFLYRSSVYSCHLFLISSASVRSISFLSFIVPIFAWNVPLVTLIFLKRSLSFPFYSFPLFLWSVRKAFLSLLAILWNSAVKYLSFSPFPLASLVFSAICMASSDKHLAFLHFFFLGDGLDRCLFYNIINLRPYFFRHSIRSNPLNLFVSSTV